MVRWSSTVDMGIEKGIIQKSGSWISYNDEKIAQGRDKAVQYIKENPQIAEEIVAKIKETVKI